MSTGILALWNDCVAEHRDTYEAWYAEEHLPERLGLPGFLRGRRYAAIGPGTEYFTYYEVKSAEVLVSDVYLERVNDPTPRTCFVMAEAFRNMSRTICDVAARHGRMRGAWAVTVTGTGLPDPERVAARRGIARVELWRQSPLDAPSENAESRLRGGDVTVPACLFAETFHEVDAQALAADLPGARIWQFLGELEAPAR